MIKENPKYRTHDSPPWSDPPVEWGPSLTDPSQDIRVDTLVAKYQRDGVVPIDPAHYGVDMRTMDVIEATRRLAEAQAEIAAAEKAAVEERSKILSDAARVLKAGSPEALQLAASLTKILPGFQEVLDAAPLPAPKPLGDVASGGSSKA